MRDKAHNKRLVNERIKDKVVEWDEYLQGYDKDGRLIVCICGETSLTGDWSYHFCPADPPYPIIDETY